MNDQTPINWLVSSREERIDLYRVLKSIAATTDTTIEAVMEEALGKPLLTGADYLSNVRRGKMARAKAKVIATWINRTHPEIAAETAPETFRLPGAHAYAASEKAPYPPALVRSEVGRLLPDHIPDPILEPHSFSLYVDEHAIEGPLRIISLAERKGIVHRADKPPRKPTQTLRLGEPFCFELDSPVEGTAIMLQGYQGRWHPVPLACSSLPGLLHIERGHNCIPKIGGRDSSPALHEIDHIGRHCFILTIVGRNQYKAKVVKPEISSKFMLLKILIKFSGSSAFI